MADLRHVFGADGFDAKKYDEPSFEQPPEIAFADELARHDFELNGGVIADGEIHRCHIKGDKSKSLNGWYVLFVDKISNGVFGSWKDSSQIEWCSKSASKMTEAERVIHRNNVERARKQAEKERKEKHDATAKKAAERLNACEWATPDNEYLQRKQCKPFGIKTDGEKLLVPIRNGRGEIRSIQEIKNNGDKKFIAGGEIAGNFHVIGSTLTEPTFVVEGYATGATIHDLTKMAVIVAFNSGNLKPAMQSLRDAGNQQHFIVCADNDRKLELEKGKNPGVEKAKEAAEAIFAASYVVPTFIGTEGTDFNDLYISQGKDVVLAQLQGKTEPANKLKFKDEDDLDDAKKTDWLVEDFLTTEAFSVMFGASGAFKSFVAIDMGMSVATGHTFHGHTTKQSKVAYICGEGANGIKKRVKAWKNEHNVTGKTGFMVSSRPVRFLDHDAINELRGCLLEMGEVDLVIVDTLNRNFGDGDENKTEDMTAFVDNCTALIKEFGCNLLVVHHTGLGDASRARGSSALRAALDTELCVERTADDVIRLKTTKQKDEEEHKPVTFNHKVVCVGEDNGVALTSCVLEVCHDEAVTQKSANNIVASGKRQEKLIEALDAFKTNHLARNPEAVSITINKRALDEELHERGLTPDARSKIRKWAVDNGVLRELDAHSFEYKIK